MFCDHVHSNQQEGFLLLASKGKRTNHFNLFNFITGGKPMTTKNLNDYTCITGNDNAITTENTLENLLEHEEKKHTNKRKKNVRKAIEKYIERNRLRNDLSDFDAYDLI